MKSNRRGSRGLNVYANLSNRRKANKDAKARRKAEYLATLPKHPVKRFFYRLHPKRFFGYWFSREGGIMALKVAGVGALLLVLMFGVLFAYYRRELDSIRPSELSKRVATTVTKYVDRNGVVLWEDKGDGDYKSVVESKNISQYMKQATVAIEDKDFYKHGGFSFTGILRAALSNSNGSSGTQGGSTLTQQLVKQVFFPPEEAQKRGLNGIPRKIKEIILSVEVERMYNKDQILTLYLNESPYGGRRNGVESAAQTYFGKSAKDLNLAESALLASIPQSPTYYNPYSKDPEALKALVARSRITLQYMAEQHYITQKEADNAKKITVLDTVKDEQSQYAGMKAPHFVQMVKTQLEQELGKKTVGEGGLTIKTTLDYRAQEIVDKAIVDLFNTNKPRIANFDNGAATVIDVPTGQILAMRGSRDYDYPDYGTVNAATAFIQPGSSIKPFVYTNLMKQRTGVNFGAGSLIADNPLPQSVYTTGDGKSVQNFDFKFKGNMPIRNALDESRNIPAINAMRIGGQANAIQTIHDMGDLSYCTDRDDKTVGLASAIGGCGLKQIEHANTFATMARMGVYKPVASVLEVKNAQGQIIKQWKDTPKQVVDPQITYMLADILSDANARAPSFGLPNPGGQPGMVLPDGIKSGTKTGTSNAGEKSKDLWMNSFTPRVATSIWVGNHLTTPMSQALSTLIGPTMAQIQVGLHKDIFEKDGTWKPNDWFTQPAGIQRISVNGRSDLYPSWYNKAQANQTDKITFDKVSKKKATTCTPDAAKEVMDVSKFTDPLTNTTTYLSPNGYDTNADDDVHKCDDVKPFATSITTTNNKITAVVGKGTHDLQTVEFRVGGQVVGTATASAAGPYSINYTGTGTQSISVTVIDNALYTSTPAVDTHTYP